MKIFHKRGLNEQEKYICSEKDIKLYFKDTNISVGFGARRAFRFDFSMHKHPQIKGSVVLDIMVNNRNSVSSCIMSIYPTNSLSAVDKTNFTDKLLPEVYKWYTQYTDSNNNLCGLNQLVVEYYNSNFIFHKLHCM